MNSKQKKPGEHHFSPEIHNKIWSVFNCRAWLPVSTLLVLSIGGCVSVMCQTPAVGAGFSWVLKYYIDWRINWVCVCWQISPSSVRSCAAEMKWKRRRRCRSSYSHPDKPASAFRTLTTFWVIFHSQSRIRIKHTCANNEKILYLCMSITPSSPVAFIYILKRFHRYLHISFNWFFWHLIPKTWWEFIPSACWLRFLIDWVIQIQI